jgi:hypothetical protein
VNGDCKRMRHPYRGIFRAESALGHIMLPCSELRRAMGERRLHGPFAGHQQGSALLIRGRMAFQQREELMSQDGLDLLEGVGRVPAVSLLSRPPNSVKGRHSE